MTLAPTAQTRTDPSSRDVFRHQLSGVADEMSTALRLSSYSSIIWNMYDYTCALLTPKGEIIAAQLGILPMAFAAVTRTIPIETWEEGDAILTNDPYSGCTHTPDMVLFSPVFHGENLVAVAATVAHHVDIGGKVPCSTAPDNLDIFSEGIRITPMRLLDRGVTNTIAGYAASYGMSRGLTFCGRVPRHRGGYGNLARSPNRTRHIER